MEIFRGPLVTDSSSFTVPLSVKTAHNAHNFITATATRLQTEKSMPQCLDASPRQRKRRDLGNEDFPWKSECRTA